MKSADNDLNRTSRRSFLKTSGGFAMASALTGVTVPRVHAAGSDALSVALVGCGGRGTGAVANALATKGGAIKLTAMADVFEDRLSSSYSTLKKRFGDQIQVPQDRRFLGFDGYRGAMENLGPGDIAIFATPPAFRWVHFKHAIAKGINVFMEKPVTVDGPTSRRMLQLADESVKKNLKVGVGLMCRHCKVRQELVERIRQGEIGDIVTLRGYRMHGPLVTAFSRRRPANTPELEYQIRRFHSFLWTSGGLFNDFYIHNIDEGCWIKGAWPVKAQALGGRHYRGDNIDQNFDTYAVEYTFEDGTKFFFDGRTMIGVRDEFGTYAHGSKGLAVISRGGHSPARSRTFKGHVETRENLLWRATQPEPNPYQLEWDDLVEAIRKDKPMNEVRGGVEASLVCSMGRMAAHTGKEISYEQILESGEEFAPGVAELTLAGEAPIKADADGRYPVPMPGLKKLREY